MKNLDFTLYRFQQMIESLLRAGYHFLPVKEYFQQRTGKVIFLRHDVDLRPLNSFNMAKIEHQMGIAGTYYFRIVKQSFNKDIIHKISALGHEIGYHYEDLAMNQGNMALAYQSFSNHLAIFRQLYPVQTICMHGSPLSKFDNRKLWEKYDYKKFGLILEPYLDMDFNSMYYLSDTGRTWANKQISIRDKTDTMNFKYTIRNTRTICHLAEQGLLPDQLMITLHPQRWTNNAYAWFRELILQNIKNIIKGVVVRKSNP